MSKVLVVYLEERFQRSSAGVYYSNIFGGFFWRRYLEVYDFVYIVARAEPDRNLMPQNLDWMIADTRLKFIELPYYKGGRQLLIKIHKVLFAVWMTTRIRGVHILRLPGILSSIALPFLLVSRKVFGVELVGDPQSVFSVGGVGGRFSKCYEYVFTTATRLACKHAKAVAYVTKHTMQRRYPASSRAYATFYSSIDLPSEIIVSDRLIKRKSEEQAFRLFMAGTMEQRYKGFDIMIKAMERIASSGHRANLILAGDGAFKSELEYLARSLEVSKNIVFLGKVSREQVLREMDLADMFVIPSRTEGLPRVLIEAMARGLPSVGTNVGGIPELLASNFLVEREDYVSLANLICNLIDDYAQRKAMSEDNIRMAHSYESSVLRGRRIEFYEYLAARAGEK
ncbi:glycosyltransferase family 4 protein [Pseudomonas sp. MTM4]|uniref:glycosyltransferase n=1 Tax=unclassified Pseudomonas TaxID=196821 RepID=UPI0018D24475|nr:MULTISPECIES: glycosyltransferase [unclassified Pseudomonas]MBC8651632.1 glycosyltransferase family 4 protein [Pseudomonas sp. MT4]QXY91342.1 glycosyltransferase family 4 protein [Pseudomonas sp. MTM4]